MQKGLLLNKAIFIQEIKQDIKNYYQIEEKEIGHGAFGKVLLGKLKAKTNVLRAIKVIKKQYNSSQYNNEIKILKMLDHPNILKLYQIFEDKQNIYLVTDYFEGGDLYQRLEEKQFSEEEARQIFKQVLEAVYYCHCQKVMHRDIKPQNLLFMNKKSLNLKLIDFGLSFKWQTDVKKQLRRGLKAAGSIYYVSPEVIANNYNQKCDIWSLGVLLYILITAQFPFDGNSDSQISQNIKNMKFTTEIANIPKINPQLRDLLQKLITKQNIRLNAIEIFQHPWLIKKQSSLNLKLNFNKLVSFSKFSKVKTLAVTYIASQLPEKQIQKLATLFKQIDVNHDGYLSVQEIKSAFEKQKQKASLQQLSKILQYIDTDKDGRINYTQFISCCMENSTIFKEQNLKAAFKILDKDQNGKIERDQLKLLLQQSNMNYDAQMIQEMMNACDKNGDGFIDYKQFVDSISKH